MRKSTKILSEEHEHILEVLSVLTEECSRLESGEDLDKDFFEKAVDFIKNYADKFHHAKEEDILFKELCKDTVEMHCNPTEQMLYEHNLGRDFIKGLEGGLKENNKNKVTEKAEGYAQLLQEHIFKEDNILYPMADEALNEATEESILELFAQTEKEKFGKGVKEKYLAIVKELKK